MNMKTHPLYNQALFSRLFEPEWSIQEAIDHANLMCRIFDELENGTQHKRGEARFLELAREIDADAVVDCEDFDSMFLRAAGSEYMIRKVGRTRTWSRIKNEDGDEEVCDPPFDASSAFRAFDRSEKLYDLSEKRGL